MNSIFVLLPILLAGNILLLFQCPKNRLRKGIFLAAAQLLLLYAASLALCRFTLGASDTLPLAVITAGLLGTSALYCFRSPQPSRLRRFALGSIGCVCISILLEFVLFCGNCYSTHPRSEEIPLSEWNVMGLYEKKDDCIVVQGNANLILSLERKDVRYLTVNVESEDAIYGIRCQMNDENHSMQLQDIGRNLMNHAQTSTRFSIIPHGTVYKLDLQFEDVQPETPVNVTGLSIQNVKPFGFSLPRILLLSGILVLFTAIRCFRWHRIYYDRHNLIHKEILAFFFILCELIICNAMPLWSVRIEPYSTENVPHVYDVNALTFDAWQRGQVHVEIPVEPALLELENPYDMGMRESSGIAYEWDLALYDGKYYSYFGIAPVIFVYYPIWLCTGGIPTLELTALIFTILSVVFLFLLVLTLVRRYCKRVNFLLLLSGLAAAVCASGIFLCANFADRYYTTIIAAICFLYLFLWLGLEAVTARGQAVRCCLFAGCALAIAAAVLSRPLISLYALFLVPVFWNFIRRDDLHKRQRIAVIASFAVPLCIGAAVTMAYNAARFSSPLEFGAVYQLTVSDISANQVSLRYLPMAITYYFLNPMRMGEVFPFIHLSLPVFSQNARYFYLDAGCGAWTFLLIPAAMCFLPKLSAGREKRTLCIMAFALTAVIAFLDFCMGGYHIRYLCDILPVLAVFSVLVILDVQRRFRRSPTLRRACHLLFLQAPVLMAVILLAYHSDSAVWYGFPDLFFELQELLVFWH